MVMRMPEMWGDILLRWLHNPYLVIVCWVSV